MEERSMNTFGWIVLAFCVFTICVTIDNIVTNVLNAKIKIKK